MGKRKFGELELSIRKVLEKRKKATVNDVVLELEGSCYTTIMTVLSRMATKKELLREKIGKQYIYWINPSSNEAKTILSRLQEKLFGGKKSSFVSYLLENDNELSEEELTHIETLITTHKNKQKNG